MCIALYKLASCAEYRIVAAVFVLRYPYIVLQAVADCRYNFRDVYANTPGAHDASVYRRSPLSHFISTNMPVRSNEISGVEVPLHILGDPAYPLFDHIIKGYPGKNLTAEKDSFNVHLSSSCMCVEIAFEKQVQIADATEKISS